MRDYKLKLETAIYNYLYEKGVKNKYKYFNIRIEKPKIKINNYRFFYPRFIVFYNHENICRFDFIESKSLVEEDVKFIFSSPFLIKKLFKITCKLKRI